MLTESWVGGKSVEEKDAQPTERTAALWGLSSKIDSRMWVNFTRNGLRLGSRHQEPPHTDVTRNLATVVIRGVLPGLKRRRTGLLLSGPKSSFQMRTSFVFHLENKVLESGGKVEKLIAQVAWSLVLSFHSLWWFGVQCHLLVLVHCVFWKPKSLHPFTTCTIWQYLLSVILIFVNLATMWTRALSTVDKHAFFLKTPASLQFSDLHFNILFSEKCNSSSVHLWEGERARERERDTMYVWITTLTMKLWL